jgi:flagellar motor switch protein FliN
MTDIPDAPANNPLPELRSDLRHWCEAWKTSLEDVLSHVPEKAASGQTDAFEISPQSLPVADSDVWYTVVAGGAAHGEMTLRLPAASGTRLAQKFLGETGRTPEPTASPIAPENITPENKEALEKLLRQVAGLAAAALAADAGGEVQFHLSASAAPTWSSDAIVCLQTVCLQTTNEAEAAASIAIEIRISPALAAALQPPPSSQASSKPAAHHPSSAEPSPAASYRRLMDVGLDVKLRFGTRRMLLRDVLALSAGVVVELDNTLHSPVDLLLDGRLIAHGEVVIVDGKYGLRVTDVVDPPPAAASPI